MKDDQGSRGARLLQAWMLANGWNDMRLGAALSKHAQTVYMWRLGKNLPGIVPAVALERLTNGIVAVTSWIEPANENVEAAE